MHRKIPSKHHQMYYTDHRLGIVRRERLAIQIIDQSPYPLIGKLHSLSKVDRQPAWRHATKAIATRYFHRQKSNFGFFSILSDTQNKEARVPHRRSFADVPAVVTSRAKERYNRLRKSKLHAIIFDKPATGKMFLHQFTRSSGLSMTYSPFFKLNGSLSLCCPFRPQHGIFGKLFSVKSVVIYSCGNNGWRSPVSV